MAVNVKLEYESGRRYEAQENATKRALLENEALTAYQYATRYDSFHWPLVNSSKEPPESKTFTERKLWIKVFRRGDARQAGISKKFGNISYAVKSTVSIRDMVSDSLFRFAIGHTTTGEFNYLRNGQEHELSMNCLVEKLDDGDWIASEYRFGTVATTEENTLFRESGRN